MLTIANVEQAAAWDGPEGAHWAEHADRYERAGWRHQARFEEAGLISETDHVLDIGCGTGKSTRDAARVAVKGAALGVDLSAQMLERGRERAAAEGLPNVEFLQADAQVHPFDAGAFDVAISSFGCMFFGDPVAAFANIGAALTPDGRLALYAWREIRRNEWVSEIRNALAVGRDLPEPPPDAPTPFSLADPERVQRIFGAAGFTGIDLLPVDEPLEFGTDADDAYGFVAGLQPVLMLLADLDETDRAKALDNVRATVAAHETPDGVVFRSAAWVMTARRP